MTSAFSISPRSVLTPRKRDSGPTRIGCPGSSPTCGPGSLAGRTGCGTTGLSFISSPPSRHERGYTDTLRAATDAGSVAVFGCFALDGPESCSGLPVARYDAAALAEQLGPEWTLIAQAREEHRTPGGGIQPFTWASFRRQRAG